MSSESKNHTEIRGQAIICFLIAALAFVPAIAGADTYIYGPTVIDSPGTYVLMSDVLNYNGTVYYNGTEYWEPCFKILASDVVLDGNGHTITGVVNSSRTDYYLSLDYVPDQNCIMVNPGLERVHVKNFRILGEFDVGIYYHPVVDGLIENNELSDNAYGIFTWSTNNVDIIGNTATGNRFEGIFCQGYFDGKIQGNTANNNDIGIHLLLCEGNTIDNNTANSNKNDGINDDGGSGNTFSRNTANLNAHHGINLTHCHDSTVRKNTADSNGNNGIFLWNTSPHAQWNGITVDDNHAWRNGWDGINLTNSSYNVVSSNSVEENNIAGISLNDFDLCEGDGNPGWDTTKNLVDSNEAHHNGMYGIISRGASENTYRANHVSYNPIGIDIGEVNLVSAFLLSDVNLLEGNVVHNNEITGIYVHGHDYVRITSQNKLTGNKVAENDRMGIHLAYANAHTVKDNVIFGNGEVGMQVNASAYNNIFNNCFNNTYNVAFGDMIFQNTWNVLKQPGPNIVGGMYISGNYWAEPDGTGHSQVTGPNDDEFCNLSLYLASLNVDNFPLWNPLDANFTATPTSGPAPLTVSFTDTSYGHPTCWHWDFGDGNTSDNQNPTHTYAVNGNYPVTLTVWRCAVEGCAAGDTAGTDIEVGTLAEFTATPLVGPVPLMVTFTDNSIGATSWEWKYKKTTDSTWTDFTQINEQNPIQVFNSSGLYDIWLHVEGSAPDDKIKTDYIDARVPLPCDSDFIGAPLTGPKPLTVQFTDLSTNNPMSWTWEYRYPSGSGSWTTFSTLQNPSNQFVNPGAYDIRLTATNEGSGTPEEKNGYITVEGPQADFVASPRSGITELTVYFTDLSTNDPGSWKWYYRTGSGPWTQFATTQDPNYTFSMGTYDIMLIVDDGEPWAHEEVKTGYITVSQIPAPEADFSGSPRKGIKPLTVDFVDLSANAPTSWTWEYSYPSGTESWTTFSTDKHPSKEFVNPGVYDVRLTVTNSGGPNSNTKTAYITVDNIPAPDVDFTASPRSGTAPLTVDFTDLSSNAPTLWAWDFNNDGITDSYEQHPTHTFNEVGTYTVKLTAINEGGPSSFKKDNYITVSNIPAPTANFTAVPRSGIKPLTVNFVDQSTGSPTAWAWDFNNDGVVDSTEKNPVHTYPSPGTYIVKLNVSNAGGYNVNTIPFYIVVEDIPLPSADFTATPLSNITPLNVAFTDTSTGGVTSWFWDFGDGTTSNLQSPTHTFTTPRKYTVSLTVSNVRGQDKKTKVEYIYVKNIPPIALFNADPRTGDAPLTVQFTDESTGLGITSWQWNFGDGSTSTTQSPLYVYNTAGTYTVTLTVANDGGANTNVKTNYITVSPAPPANIIKLYPGWNFVSVPKRLASGHNTAFQVFGGVNLGGHAILLWDAQNGMWKQVMAGDTLQPLNGYWVYSVTRVDVPLTFDTVTPPAPYPKQLYTGWNAVGYAGTTSMSAHNFLTIMGGLDGNWGTLLGYHEGNNPDSPIIRDSNDGLPMYPTKGYWISMNNNDTLTVVV